MDWIKVSGILAVGTLVLTLCTPTYAQQLTVLHNFANAIDGDGPIGGLSLGPDGYIYGSTVVGGAQSSSCTGSGMSVFSVVSSDPGCGTLFKISTLGAFTSLAQYSFPAYPNAPVVEVNTSNNYWGFPGTINTADPSFNGPDVGDYIPPNSSFRTCEVAAGATTVNGSLVSNPGYAIPMVLGHDGSIYGTVFPSNGAAGTAFKIANPTNPGTPCSNFISSGSFTGAVSPLVQGSNGVFYGVTPTGGASNVGTVFSLTTSGVLTTLYSFSNGADGETPVSSLVFGNDGNLYGTTTQTCYGFGQRNTMNQGTVFRITTAGVLTTLFSFPRAQPASAKCPTSPLILDSTNGLFYGTSLGGAGGNGIIYSIRPGDGLFNTVYTFPAADNSGNIPNGSRPYGSLVLQKSTLFGGTAAGGANYVGVIYSFAIPTSTSSDGPMPMWVLIVLMLLLLTIASSRFKSSCNLAIGRPCQ